MGWQEMKKRAEQFKQQTDAAMLNDVLQPTLFSGAQVTWQHSYECIHEAGAPQLAVGETVRFIDTPDGVDIYKGTRPVGQLSTDQAQLLHKQHKFSKSAGKSLLGTVTQVSTLTNTFIVDVAS